MTGEKKRVRHWTREKIILEIRALPQLSAKWNQRLFPSLYGAAVRHFGSWRRAVGAAGLNYDSSFKRKAPGYWTREKVVLAIQVLPEKSSIYVRNHHADLYSAALRLFDGWREAVEAAGLDYRLIRKSYRD